MFLSDVSIGTSIQKSDVCIVDGMNGWSLNNNSHIIRFASSAKNMTFLEGETIGSITVRVAVRVRELKYGLINNEYDALHEIERDVAEFDSRMREYVGKATHDECELLYGRAGALSAVKFLTEQLNGLGRKMTVQRLDELRRLLVCEIVSSGLKKVDDRRRSGSSSEMPLIYEWHKKEYVGIAHGYLGIIYSLLASRDIFGLCGQGKGDFSRTT